MRSHGKAFRLRAPGLLLSTLASTAAVLSCGAQDRDPASGPSSRTSIPSQTSPGGRSSTGSTLPGEEVGGRWELADKLPTLRRAAPRARSQHLTGDLEAETLANELAPSYPALGPNRPLKAGAVLVEPHFTPGSPDPSVLFAMVKRAPGFYPEGGDWEYLIVEPGGSIVRRGKLPLCARCHAEAPHNFIFGGPR